MGELSIRTPDQRLRVFVSSTLAELADERAAVHEAIERLQVTPVMFELARAHTLPATYTGPTVNRATFSSASTGNATVGSPRGDRVWLGG
jgi:hypothetical protein